ncbi:hypothetical protein IG631_04856 [Alternaria alternata]|nr:hypothetical protein IG631_04856 [Alternaria alternata]
MGKAKIETRAAELVAGGRAKLEPLFRVTRPPDGMKTIRFANLGMERAWEMGSACGSSAIVPILWLGSCVMVARIPCCFDFCVVVVDQQTRSVNMQTSTWQRLRSSASHCIASAAVWQRANGLRAAGRYEVNGWVGARAPCLPATRAKRHKAPCENASSPIYHSIPSRSLSSARRVSSSLDRSHSPLVIASSSCCRACRVPDYTCLPCGGKHARIAPSLPQYTIQQITLGHADNTNHALSTLQPSFLHQDPPSPGLVWST